jgi:hypothetical protein
VQGKAAAVVVLVVPMGSLKPKLKRLVFLREVSTNAVNKQSDFEDEYVHGLHMRSQKC